MSALDEFNTIVAQMISTLKEQVLADGVVLAGVAPPPPLPSGSSTEEFVGPFASWVNLQTAYGAIGDGVADDTAAIQAALDDLATGIHSPTLYIPSGTYKVMSTLTLIGIEGISIIGESPDTAILRWAGSNDGNVLWLDGVSYSRVCRLTFDGNGMAGALIDQSLQQSLGGTRQFDTGNEYADLILKDAQIGIRGGNAGYGASEVSVLRCKFLGTGFGISLKNFNALDWWIWDSHFENNNYAITNNPGAGNFNVYGSVFKGSSQSDIEILNTGNFSFRDNFSIDSKIFVNEEFYFTNGATTRAHNNRVISPAGTEGIHWFQGNMGPDAITDNQFFTPAGELYGSVNIYAFRPPDAIAVGNTYTYTGEWLPIAVHSQSGDGRFFDVDNHVVSSIDATEPILPIVPPNNNRQIFEVASSATSVVIQQAINQAAALNGQKPIVHLQYGNYSLNAALTIPPCDLQLVGDGFGAHATRLAWAGSGPAIILQGPSKATLMEFGIVISGDGTGILIDDADQPGSRVYLQQPQLTEATTACLFVDGLDHTLVEIRNAAISYTAVPPANGIGLDVVGGSLASAGTPAEGRTVIMSGGGGVNHITNQVSNGGNLTVRDFWYEGGNQTLYAKISGPSTFMMEGSRVAVPSNNGHVIEFVGFSGKATIMACTLSSNTDIDEASTGSVWVVANDFSQSPQWLTENSGSGTVYYNLNRRLGGDGSEPIPDAGPTPGDAWMQEMLEQIRNTKPSVINDLGVGVTDVRIYRVGVQRGAYGIRISPSRV